MRGMAEGRLAPPLGSAALASLTFAGGPSGGALPLPRSWYLGGSRPVRGQWAGFLIGDSFWMSRVELGATSVFARPVVFADFGWAGDRSDFARPGRVGSGVGIGASIFDGTLRLDIARGVWPSEGIRGMIYLEGWE
jgi:hemolysin activation/secretion protein